jgi:hypothetical protein
MCCGFQLCYNVWCVLLSAFFSQYAYHETVDVYRQSRRKIPLLPPHFMLLALPVKLAVRVLENIFLGNKMMVIISTLPSVTCTLWVNSQQKKDVTWQRTRMQQWKELLFSAGSGRSWVGADSESTVQRLWVGLQEVLDPEELWLSWEVTTSEHTPGLRRLVCVCLTVNCKV